VNAAFLLVTTAWFAGAEAAPATTAAPAATSAGTVMSTPLTGAVGTGAHGAGGCCGGTDCGCGNECCCKVGFLQKLRARFQRNNCCCETTCCGCGGNVGNVGGCGANVGGCGGGNVGNCCCECDCCKPSLLQRLRARMQRNNCCCETSCCGGGCDHGAGSAGVPGVMPGAAEPIKLPKDATPGNKLPSSGKSGGTVQSHGLGLTPASSANLLETEKNPF
jgi:hypothetical protein